MKKEDVWDTSQKSDLLPAGKWFGISEIACQLAAMEIARLPIPKTGSQSFWDERDQTEKFYFVSVCHQMNWNDLECGFERLFEGLKSGTDITEFVLKLSEAQFDRVFEGYREPQRLRARERVMMLRQSANELKEHFAGSVGVLYEASQKRLAGANGIYASLEAFSAFREDPLRKKSNVFVHELLRNGNLEFIDPENTRPAIDYHIIRLYLRTGRVFPIHQAVLDRLIIHDPSPRKRLITEARKATAEALSAVAHFSGMNVAEINYVEWMVGRTRCLRDSPICSGNVEEHANKELPLLKGRECCFREFCATSWLDDWSDIWEPVFKSTHY